MAYGQNAPSCDPFSENTTNWCLSLKCNTNDFLAVSLSAESGHNLTKLVKFRVIQTRRKYTADCVKPMVKPASAGPMSSDHQLKFKFTINFHEIGPSRRNQSLPT